MATNDTRPIVTNTQLTTDDLNLVSTPIGDQKDELYPPTGPQPPGTKPEAVEKMAEEDQERQGVGIEGEEVVWEGRYAMKNFLGRLIGLALLTVLWCGWMIWMWESQQRGWRILNIVLGVAVGLLWLVLGYRILRARLGHRYSLTNRRLFVSTGVMKRRRDQLELLRINDVFTRQSWPERVLSVGTVVIVSSEKDVLPTVYLPGVNDPKRVMDLVWHYARRERDRRTTRIQQV